MNIKNFLLITLFILPGCLPEQPIKPKNNNIERSTVGQVVFEALTNNVVEECGPQRRGILQSKKHLFISKFDDLFKTFSNDLQQEKIGLFADFMQNKENSKKILKAADFIEKKRSKIAKLNLKDIKELLSSDNRELERLILYLVHSQDLENLLAELADPTKADPSMLDLATKFQTLADKMPAQIDLVRIAQKVVSLIDDSSDYKKLGLKIIDLLAKFSDPARIKAAQDLKNIMTKVDPNLITKAYPDITEENIKKLIAWLKRVPSALDWPAGAIKLAVKTGAAFNILPGFLPDFIDQISADNSVYKSLMSNTKLLYEAGILDELVELLPEAKTIKKDIKKEYYDDLKKLLIMARKILPMGEHILEAPATVVAQVLLQVLATNEQSQCRITNEKSDLSSTLENWAKSLVTFMKDSEKGLLHVLSLIRVNL
jgi:hypothetical protein